MSPLDAIRRSLENPREGERGVLMRRTAITLTLLGFVYAELYALAFAVPGATARVAWCGVALLVLCVLSVLLPPRPIFATTTALTATLIICVILTAPDRTSIVPLFFLWPMGALAYFHSPRFLAFALTFAAAALSPVLFFGASAEQRVVYIGTVSIAVLMAALVALMRNDEQRLRHSLLQSSSTDSLTGLLNRRALMPAFQHAIDHARAAERDLAVVIVDLDHFKQFNDGHGHVAGDRALRRVAKVLRAAAGRDAIVGRLGGEEFAVVLPGRTQLQAQRYCDRVAAALAPVAPTALPGTLSTAGVRAGLRAQLAAIAQHDESTAGPVRIHATSDAPTMGALSAPVAGAAPAIAGGAATLTPPPPAQPASSPLRLADSRRHSALDQPAITASFGIAHMAPGTLGDADPSRLLGHADTALYAAKRAGRDRAGVWAHDHVALAPPFHLDGRLMVGAVDDLPLLSTGAQHVPEPHVLLERRGRLFLRISAAMFLLGALNTGIAMFMIAHGTKEMMVRAGTLTALVVIGAAMLRVPPTRQVAAPVSFLGVSLVSLIIATQEPMGSTALFYVWPVAMVAYFGAPRASLAALLWTAVNLAAALTLSSQQVDATGLYAGLMLNLIVLSLFITSMRWREEQLANGLEQASIVDPLTGTLTRRGFLPVVERWIGGQAPGVALLLLDVDDFKRFNDQHGHLAGDDALRQAGDAMRAALPDGALLCRFGGEEFAVAVPTGGLPAARACADAIAAHLAATPQQLTVSVGIAVRDPAEIDVESLVGRADTALYAAKAAGRNRAAWRSLDVPAGAPIVAPPFGGEAEQPPLPAAA